MSAGAELLERALFVLSRTRHAFLFNGLTNTRRRGRASRLGDGDVGTRGPNLGGLLAIPTETEHPLASGEVVRNADLRRRAKRRREHHYQAVPRQPCIKLNGKGHGRALNVGGARNL